MSLGRRLDHGSQDNQPRLCFFHRVELPRLEAMRQNPPPVIGLANFHGGIIPRIQDVSRGDGRTVFLAQSPFGMVRFILAAFLAAYSLTLTI
jgi:hypothetical protein